MRVTAWALSALLIGALAGWQYALIGPVLLEVTYLTAGVIEVRREASAVGEARAGGAPSGGGAAGSLSGRLGSAGRRASRMELDPAAGHETRFDRVPRWVRLWHSTPFADRHAHAWMWRHGGFDVISPDAWAPASSD